MLETKVQIEEYLDKANNYYGASYFSEALFEYGSALELTIKLIQSPYFEDVRNHIIAIYEKRASCLEQLGKHTEALESYRDLVRFLIDNCKTTNLQLLLRKNYSGISSSVLETLILADKLESELNFIEAFKARELALNFISMLTLQLGDLLSFKVPSEVLKQAKLANLLKNIEAAKTYYEEAVDLANRYIESDPEYFRTYAQEAFNNTINFYELLGEEQEVNRLVDSLVEFLEKHYNSGDTLDFNLAGDIFVRKALRLEGELKKKYLDEAFSHYNYVAEFSNPFYYYIANIEAEELEKNYCKLDDESKYETYARYFYNHLKNKYGTLYYLLSIKKLLLTKFKRKDLSYIQYLQNNLEINKSRLRERELELYTGIEVFFKAIDSLLNFQNKILLEKEEQDTDAEETYAYFRRLWNLNFVSNSEAASLLVVLSKLYKETLQNSELALKYLSLVPNLYKKEVCREEDINTFVDAYYELSLYYTEVGGFEESLEYLDIAIELLERLYKSKPLTYARRYHDALVSKGVTNYNFFDNYDLFNDSLTKAIDSLEINIQDSQDLIKFIKTLALKASVDYSEENKEKALADHERIAAVYEFYSFKNSGNLDRIYTGIISSGIDLARELGRSEVEETFINSRNTIKLLSL